MSLIELAERVEKARGPHRLLDANILWAIKPDAFEADADEDDEHLQPSYCYARGGWTMNRADHYYLDTIPVPRFTASLDAALTLVPECAWDHMEVYKPDFQTLGWTVHLLPNGNFNPSTAAEGFGQSWPLALCAAALRARAQQEQTI